MKYEIKVPESLEEINLKQYQKYLEIAQNNEDTLFVSQKMIEIFCDIKLIKVAEMKVNSVLELNAHFKQVFEQKYKFKNRFTLNGIEFGFIPNLEDITLEEYIDIEMYLKDVKTLHKALSIMYRPIKDKSKELYTIHNKEYGQRFDEVLRYATLDIVIPAQVFFWNLSSELLNATTHYLKKELKKLTTQHKDKLAKSGDGITQSIDLQMEILQNSMKLQPLALIQLLHI